jgi:ATP-dependent RNA helicase RhlE
MPLVTLTLRGSHARKIIMSEHPQVAADAAPFSAMPLAAPILKALASAGLVTPTPIQAAAIPLALEGRDLIGLAQTGTGKTAAFALPIIERLARHPDRPAPRAVRALILAPTRELAAQISETFRTLGKNLHLRHAVVFGGVSHRPQALALQKGLDILVATPGRLLDHMEIGNVTLAGVEILVLDEADRMFDMGFMPALRRILKQLPKDRQSMLFSATMPTEIRGLAEAILQNPAQVAVTPQTVTADKIAQSVIHVPGKAKRALLLHTLADKSMDRVIVFTRTKHGANRVAESLDKGGISSAAIHGNKSQGARVAALNGFKAGKVRVLVATDIAARGIDVTGISHVINYELPDEPESYVHRIGRTARAGAEGSAIAFCDPSERHLLRAIEKLTGVKPEVLPLPADLAAFSADLPALSDTDSRRPESRRPQRQNQRGDGARHEGGRPDGGRHEGGRRDGARSGPRGDGPRSDAPRGDGRRPESRSQEPRRGENRPAPAATRPFRPDPAPRPGQNRSRAR